MTMLDEAVEAIRNGDKSKGRELLEEILETEEDNEEVWLWLSSVVDADEDREICLENVLALNPDNMIAQRGLEALRSGTFNVHDLTGEALEARGESEEEEDDGATFHEQFFTSEDDDSLGDDDDIAWPSVMEDEESEGEGAGLLSRINIRLVLIAAIGLLVVCGLGSAAAYNIFLSGDGSAVENQPGQEAPAGGTEPEATPTETPTLTPTPTPTSTPFELPTTKPTDLPTPTATMVVSPTPSGG